MATSTSLTPVNGTSYYPNSSPASPIASSSLRFPSDLGKNGFNYWFSFSFYKYSRPTNGGTSADPATGGTLTDNGVVRLPFPNQMVDHQDVVYNENPVNAGTAAIIAGMTGKSSVSSAAGGAAAGNLLNNPLGDAGLQNSGATVNPYLSVFFKAPAFKKHALSWKLCPSNQGDSVALNQIVNTFRYNQLPSQFTAANGVLLGYPNIVQITVSCNSPTYFSYVFKPAVLETVEVNFTPSAQPSMFGTTNAPTEIELRLGLLEIEFWLQSDYAGSGPQQNLPANIQADWNRVKQELQNYWNSFNGTSNQNQ